MTTPRVRPAPVVGASADACPITAAGTPPGGVLPDGTVWWPARAYWSGDFGGDGPSGAESRFDTVAE